MISFLAGAVFLGGLLLGCRPAALATLPDAISGPFAKSIPAEQTAESIEKTAVAAANPTAAPALPSPVSPTISPAAAILLSPTAEPSPLPAATETSTPTATPIGPCSMRMPQDDLLAVVTLTYGISRNFAPTDLVPLSDGLPVHVTMGYPSEIREIAFGPLVEAIEAMLAEGLQPQILSAYRSYAAQAIAWNKWNDLYPDRAAIISAPPGYSEHQLGTVVDFGSPELASIVGQEDIEFHTYFNKTSEGIWLAENAHRYGFALSFPAEASEFTGFFYEPWHFRYVGIDLATSLHDMDSSLTEYQLVKHSEPCIP